MSKLDDLINKLCPDGVEYKKLETISKITIGEFVHKSKQNPKGLYPVYNGGTTNTGFYDEYNNEGNKVIISARGASAGYVNKIEKRYWAGNSCYSIEVDKKELNWIFAYYYLSSIQKTLIDSQQKGGIPAVSKKQIENLEIPVPPLEIQNEIVRILDNFTELEEELEEELEARRKQYEYYRDSLLTFDDSVEWKSLSEVTTSIKNIKWKQETNSYQYIDLSSVDRDTHSIGETTSINPETAPSRAQQIVNENDVLFGGTRPMLKRFCLISDKYNNQICSTGFCVLRANPEKILPKWIYYNLGTDAFYKHVEQYQSGASYPAISDGDVKRYKIAIPSLEEQEKIINLLDRFESLCNDITSGLPAEIEARHKQYEYYRDKLLTFKRKSA